ncbi:MAG: hypothetical protein AAF697_05980 [Pseudomonadota bacterium]
MSKQTSGTFTPMRSGSNWREIGVGRWPIYAGLAVLGLLVLAYVDAGEEPLRPIVQPVALEGGNA